jgi:hypothetical protein
MQAVPAMAAATQAHLLLAMLHLQMVTRGITGNPGVSVSTAISTETIRMLE